MTTTTMTALAAASRRGARAVAARPATLAGTLRSEFTKIRSVRSTYWTPPRPGASPAPGARMTSLPDADACRMTAAERVERLVIGADFGADGYLTLAQATDLARRLELRPGQRLLDLGTGCGWPGIYLATTAGCQAVLADLPGQGLHVAAARAAREQAAGRCSVLAADGAALPFAPAVFDAVVHADVLCCLRAKLQAMRGCRRVLRPGGQMAFYTIFVPPGLSAREHRRAVRCGPPAVAARSSYRRLLRSAGFTRVREIDVTGAYLDTARAWLRRQREFAAELDAGQPPGALGARLARREATVAAIQAGLLRRSLFITGS